MSPLRKKSLEKPANLGEQLRAWRLTLGFKQEELEARAGLAHNAVSRIETGAVSPRLETVERLAEALGIHVEELYFKVPAQKKDEDLAPELEELVRKMQGIPREKRKQLVQILESLLELIR